MGGGLFGKSVSERTCRRDMEDSRQDASQTGRELALFNLSSSPMLPLQAASSTSRVRWRGHA